MSVVSKQISFVLLLCSLLHLPAGVFACKCGQPDPAPPKALKEFREHKNTYTTTIFLGKVVTVEEAERGKQVTFQATQWWDVAIPENVQVFTEASGDTCGYGFQKGREYLVFATAQQPNAWHVSLCSSTTDNPAPFLKILGQGNKPTPVVPKSMFVLYNALGVTLFAGSLLLMYLLTLRENRRESRKYMPTD